METTVVHCKREPFDIYIGRGSIWGNPFVIRNQSEEERTRVIDAYRAWIVTQPQILSQVWKLHGKALGCFCHPKACHGDVLKAMAAAAIQRYEDSITYGGADEVPPDQFMLPGEYTAGTLSAVPRGQRY